MPGRVCPRGYFTLWPQFESEWADMLSRLSDGGDAHEHWAKEQNFSVRQRPSTKDVMHLEICISTSSVLAASTSKGWW